jgi:hypothetical protein
MKAAFWNMPLGKPVVSGDYEITVESASKTHVNLKIKPVNERQDVFIEPLPRGGIRLTSDGK